MRYVAGISWPRSGHHLLVRILQAYFGHRFRYCEFHGPKLDCCRRFPCQRGMTFTKNHDFDDVHPGNVPCLIQYREFLPSVVSGFELMVRDGAPDTPETFRRYALRRAGEYRYFLRKWCHESENRLVIKYENLTRDPVMWAVKAAEFFHDGPVDPEVMAQIVNSCDGQKIDYGRVSWNRTMGVRDTRDITKFRYYDHGFFTELADRSTASNFSRITGLPEIGLLYRGRALYRRLRKIAGPQRLQVLRRPGL